MLSLADLTAASARVAEISSRLDKTRELAQVLRQAEGDEIPIAVSYLSGETRQGKLGVSLASLQTASTVPAIEPKLTVHEVDRAFSEIAAIRGMNRGLAASVRTSDIRINVSFSIPLAALTKSISGFSIGSISVKTCRYTCDGVARMTIRAPERTSVIECVIRTDSGTRNEGR